MAQRAGMVAFLLAALFIGARAAPPAPACCAAGRSGKPVVNADQTVILLWDAATKTQHFIRQASFKSDDEDFGFLIPSPSQPELGEAGDGAFPLLKKLTEPAIVTRSRPNQGLNCGCSKSAVTIATAPGSVVVLDEKNVAGFNATVLDASSAEALVGWLKERGYAFSPEVEAWAKPYIERGWKFTALKVAKDGKEKATKGVAATALRLTFKTDEPLFPYREPDQKVAAAKLGATSRLLRIYFLAEARYEGSFAAAADKWSGTTAWAGTVGAEDRKKILEQLKLPETTGPAVWRLTEFEDNWPYQTAPGDVAFKPSAQQDDVRRQPIIVYTSSLTPSDAAAPLFLAAGFCLPFVVRRWRRASD